MEFSIGKFYKIVFQVGNNALSFSCEIIEVDNNFITFRDKYGKILTYNKSNIISSEEVENGNN